MNKSISFKIESVDSLLSNLLSISEKESSFCLLNSNNYSSEKDNHEIIAGWGGNDSIETNQFEKINKFTATQKWSFGYLNYDLKNDLENLASCNDDETMVKKSFFFKPKILLQVKEKKCFLQYDDNINNISEIVTVLSKKTTPFYSEGLSIKIKTKETYNEYIDAINLIKNHIKRGDIYEANYCTEFYAKKCEIKPENLFVRLNKISPTPFSAYIKNKNHIVLSASPERFLQRVDNKIISQPIKGTARRSENSIEDEQIKEALRNSEKDKAENVMIVDLVRNDLSKCALKQSVRVNELCKVYSFPLVHQMISTITAKVSPETNNIDIIKNAFPPGSMTGAPKVKAMKLMEQYEKTKRGIYSGAIGYFDPKGNFDFNVVIRSIIYNTENKYLSFMVGGAITDNSIPQDEYNECLIKAEAMLVALNATIE